MANFLDIDDYDLPEALAMVSAFGTERYGYVVTPNVDHVIRHYYDPQFRKLYSQASYVLLDSRFLAYILNFIKGQILRVCLGSDLAISVITKIVRTDDMLVLVGGTASQAEELRVRFGLESLRHIDPPMGFITDAAAVESCLASIESASPFRFCFLAIGSPQQEIIAQKLKERGKAAGLALCVGTAINYLTGIEKRAPQWMQRVGCEWLFRLLCNPRRLAKRYLVRGPLIFLLLWRVELRVRRASMVLEPEKRLAPAPKVTLLHGAGEIAQSQAR